jgi:putative hydrolase of the HAD superfamily
VVLRGVIFDLDDTLIDSTAADLRVWLRVVRVLEAIVPSSDHERLRERYVGVMPGHYAELAAGRVDLATFRRRRLDDAVSPWGEIDDELFERYMREKDAIVEEVRVFPDTIPVLRGLRSRGLRVGLLTNGPSDFQRRKLETTALERELDAVAISGEIGYAKPEREAFAIALSLLRTEARETAMVGDSLTADVEGALGAGLAATIWLEAAGEPPVGAGRATSLTEAVKLLGLG